MRQLLGLRNAAHVFYVALQGHMGEGDAADRLTLMGVYRPLRGFKRPVGVPREQKMLKGHLPRVINHQVYLYAQITVHMQG